MGGEERRNTECMHSLQSLKIQSLLCTLFTHSKQSCKKCLILLFRSFSFSLSDALFLSFFLSFLFFSSLAPLFSCTVFHFRVRTSSTAVCAVSCTRLLVLLGFEPLLLFCAAFIVSRYRPPFFLSFPFFIASRHPECIFESTRGIVLRIQQFESFLKVSILVSPLFAVDFEFSPSPLLATSFHRDRNPSLLAQSRLRSPSQLGTHKILQLVLFAFIFSLQLICSSIHQLIYSTTRT